MALNLRNPAGYSGQPGTQYKQGIVRFANANEVAEATATNLALSPASFATPGAIGGTTPAAGTFTNLTVNDVLAMDGGAVTDFIGSATLALGTVTIANTNITANDHIIIQRRAINGSTTLGELTYSISAGASFTITSVILGTPASPQTADLSIVSYVIIRQV